MLRSFISIPAGFLRMPIGPYTVLTLIGSAIWAFVLAGIGWAIGRSWEHFHSDFRFVDYRRGAPRAFRDRMARLALVQTAGLDGFSANVL